MSWIDLWIKEHPARDKNQFPQIWEFVCVYSQWQKWKEKKKTIGWGNRLISIRHLSDKCQFCMKYTQRISLSPVYFYYKLDERKTLTYIYGRHVN